MKKKTKNKNKKTVFVFTIKQITSRRLQKTIQVPGSISLGKLDSEIRAAMKFDQFDHISAFFDGEPYRSIEIATITPFGGGDNSDLKIDQIGLKAGIQFGYVYDFGKDIQCHIRLDDILPA